MDLSPLQDITPLHVIVLLIFAVAGIGLGILIVIKDFIDMFKTRKQYKDKEEKNKEEDV